VKPVDRLIGGSVVLALLVNLASTYLYDRMPRVHFYVAMALAAAVFCWSAYHLLGFALKYFRYGRYAVEVIFLNSRNELLLIHHPFHKCLLPPASRLKLWQLPHVAVGEVLRNEAGINEFEFHPVFHSKHSVLSEKVEDVTQPYAAQIENRRQRGLVRFHYTFLYVCKFKGTDQPLTAVPDYHPRWMSLREMKELGPGLRPFDDLILRYEMILAKLQSTRNIK